MTRLPGSFFRLAGACLLVVLLAAACAPIPGLSIPGLTGSPAPKNAPPGGASAQVPATGNITPSVKPLDQTFDGTSVVVPDVVSKGPGWMVIHNQVSGAVGEAIGETPVKDGDNKNVVVKIDPARATAVMYAMLHVDAGKVGTYEFPGPDVPVLVDGQMLTPPFKAEKANTSGVTVATVKVGNQVVKDGKVTVDEVDVPGPAWIAIHIMNPDGSPGKDIGFSGVKAGKNSAVIVTVDQTQVTQTLFAMLHQDAGEIGTYEFPGSDGPLLVNGAMVAPAFASDGTTPSASATTGMHDMNATPTGPAEANEVYPTATTAAGMGGMGAVTATPGAMEQMTAAPAATAPPVDMAVQTPEPGISPMVMVSDQPLAGGMVKVDEVVSGGPGWIVIYTTTASGQPDQAIGHSPVQKGDNKDVMVQVDPAKAKGKLFAQLHVDAGKTGDFEFPGPDLPLMVGVQMISGAFNITEGQASSPTATPMAAMNPPSGQSSVPFIKMADQPIVNGAVVVPEVFALRDSWLVIHRQNGDGTVGPSVGDLHIPPGDSTNVVVHVDTRYTSSIMWAMLHDDMGQIGRLEFPGPDVPTMVNGQMVNVQFNITGNKTADVVINISKEAGLVRHLVDGNDMSLYLSLNDAPGQSNCNADCQVAWKPLLATGKIIASSGVASNKLGVILLPDGTRQVTYAGAPLYTYTDDARPGDINGQAFDGVWFLVNP